MQRMERDDAARLAREILRDLARRSEASSTPSFLSYKLLRRLVMHARMIGIGFDRRVSGPWRVGESEPRRLSRWTRLVLPTVICGRFVLQAPTLDEATEIARFLNWCNVPEPLTI